MSTTVREGGADLHLPATFPPRGAPIPTRELGCICRYVEGGGIAPSYTSPPMVYVVICVNFFAVNGCYKKIV